MQILAINHSKFLLSILSGFLLGICFITDNQAILLVCPWIGLMPSFYVFFINISKKNISKNFVYGWAMGSIMFLISLSWMSRVSICGSILFPLYLGFYYGIWGAIVSIFCLFFENFFFSFLCLGRGILSYLFSHQVVG